MVLQWPPRDGAFNAETPYDSETFSITEMTPVAGLYRCSPQYSRRGPEAMKLQQNPRAPINLITAYGAESVTVNGVAHPCHLAVAPDALAEAWHEGEFGALQAAHLAALLAMKPAVVLLGTGSRQRFPAPAIMRPLIEAGVGCEVMDTGAACRTYNILASEGRQVVAALLLPHDG